MRLNECATRFDQLHWSNDSVTMILDKFDLLLEALKNHARNPSHLWNNQVDIRFSPALHAFSSTFSELNICAKNCLMKECLWPCNFLWMSCQQQLEVHEVKSFRKVQSIDAKGVMRRKGQRCAWDYNWSYWRLFRRPPGKELKSTLVYPVGWWAALLQSHVLYNMCISYFRTLQLGPPLVLHTSVGTYVLS